MSATQTTQESNAILFSDPTEVKEELGLAVLTKIAPENERDPKFEKQAADFVKAVLAFDPENPAHVNDREQNIASVENLGSKSQQEASHRSAMLREPIKKLAARGEDGGEVANALVDLKNQVEELDPGSFDFKAGWLSRTLGRIPGMGTPLKNFFSRFQSAQTVIDAIIRSMEDGKKILQRDNVTLAQDQKIMRKLTLNLQNVINLGFSLDEKFAYALEREISPEDSRATFIENEILFPLRQRIQDLQQQLAVNQQGVLAIEIIIRNNKELVKGVDRGINVTVNALNVAVTVALALANQKIVLDKIAAVNKVTSNLIAQTAATLKTQGVEVHKQAAFAQLDMETLKQAFEDINEALDDISSFRKKALPQMANNILEMDKLTKQTETSIQRLEEGSKLAPAITLDVTPE